MLAKLSSSYRKFRSRRYLGQSPEYPAIYHEDVFVAPVIWNIKRYTYIGLHRHVLKRSHEVGLPRGLVKQSTSNLLIIANSSTLAQSIQCVMHERLGALEPSSKLLSVKYTVTFLTRTI